VTPSIKKHQQQFGRGPRLVAADAGFFSAANATAAHQMGVNLVAIPSHSTKSEARKQQQKHVGSKSHEVAHRLRRSHQRIQTAARLEPMPLRRPGGNENPGRSGRHRR
jgi:hypothetical protein